MEGLREIERPRKNERSIIIEWTKKNTVEAGPAMTDN